MFIHITALDMVHSSLVSSMSIDPVRLQSYNMSNPPKTPQITAIPGFEVRIWSLSIISVFISLSKSAISQPCYLLTAVAQPHNPIGNLCTHIHPASECVPLVFAARDAFFVIIFSRLDCRSDTTAICPRWVCTCMQASVPTPNTQTRPGKLLRPRARRVYRDPAIHVMCLVDVCLLSICFSACRNR